MTEKPNINDFEETSTPGVFKRKIPTNQIPKQITTNVGSFLVTDDTIQRIPNMTQFVKTESKTIFYKAPGLKGQAVSGTVLTEGQVIKGTVSNLFANENGELLFIKTESGDVSIPVYSGLTFGIKIKNYGTREQPKVGKSKGDTIEITYKGTKASPKTGRKMHDFDVK